MNDAYRWMLVGHVFGDLVWVGGLFAAVYLLRAGAHAEGGLLKTVAPQGRAVGMVMDMGATLAMLFGVLLIVVPPAGTSLFKGAGFFHAKLALVLVLLGLHGMLRKRIGGLKRGEAKAPPAFLPPILGALVLGIVALIIARPF